MPRRGHLGIFMLCAICLMPVGAALCQQTEPHLVSGHIDNLTIRTADLPAAPKATVKVKGAFEKIAFSFAGPSGQQLIASNSSYHESGTHVFAQEGLFPPFAQQGTWTLTSVELCGSQSGCVTYSGSMLTALIPKVSVQVINAHGDVTAPTVTSGTILTQTIKSAKHSLIKAKMLVQDDVSGVAFVGLLFASATSSFGYPSITTDHPVTSPETLMVAGVCDCRSLPAGTYNLVQIALSDYAGNSTYITDSATIASIFGGATTIEVVH